jgi:hypothetical protein
MRIALASLLGLAACEPIPMTDGEALEALGQTMKSGQGVEATSDAIEISTSFTLGGAVQDAAQDLADFWQSQAPCSVVTVAGATLTVDYGSLDDTCEWDGKTYAGITEVTVASASIGSVEVDHTWTGFTDGRVTVDGGATVLWDGSALTRDVTTDHTWTDNSTGETVDVTGHHVMGTLDGTTFFDSGITLDGDRQWTGDDGAEWTLDMTGVEARWIDPAPQAGVLTVTAPNEKQLTITFSRVDDNTIRADLEGTRRPIAFDITALGQIEPAE